MNIIDLNKMLTDYSFRIINVTSSIRWMFDRIKFGKIIVDNQKLKDKHKGETCYILGNGPSIKNLDISLLDGKITFVVNKFYKSPFYSQIKPTYHCVYDRYIFEECKEDLKVIIDSEDSLTNFIFTRRAYAYFGDNIKCSYIYSTMLPTSDGLHIDLSKNANTWLNVIPFVIMCALYMGFSKIVLLGCDFSLFASRKDSHFYDAGESVDRKESLFQDLQGHAIVCSQHSYLKKYADTHNVEIINCTEGSLLDVYPQKSLEDYI